MGRRRKKEPKRNALYLRLTDRQLELLRLYVDFKDYDSEVDAIRHMIDGLGPWLERQLSSREIAGSGGEPPPTSVRTDAPETDVAPTQKSGRHPRDSSVGDFAGRPSIGLPKPSWNDGD